MNKLFFLMLMLAISCGQSTSNTNGQLISSSIIAGENVGIDDPIRQSAINLTNCSGTLISEDLIVTAAHCVTVSYKTMLNKVKYKAVDKVTIWLNVAESKKFDSHQITFHPEYKATPDNDIALIKIDKTLLGDNYKPVAILSPDYLLEENTELILAGFGSQSAKYIFIENERTNPLQKIRKPFLKYDKDKLIISQDTGKNGVYRGDSGGPAYLETQTELLLAGSTQGAPSLTAPTAIFINVSAHKNFILNSAKALNAKLPTFKMPNE